MAATTKVPEPITPQLRNAVAKRVEQDSDHLARPTDRARLRLAVARALAAEGIVVAPDRWARMVRDLVDDLTGNPAQTKHALDLLTDQLPEHKRDEVRRRYTLAYWYAVGREDEATGDRASHDRPELFARTHGTAAYRYAAEYTHWLPSLLDAYKAFTEEHPVGTPLRLAASHHPEAEADA